MGLRGPAPTPTSILKSRGSKRAAERKNEPAPAAVGLADQCPRWLDAEAKKEWARLLPELKRLGLITVVDVGALAGYCQAFADFRAAVKLLRREGLTTDGSRGGKVAHPAVHMKNRAMLIMAKFAAEFGFSPASRTRISTPDASTPQKSGKSRFFAGPRLATG